MTQAFVRCQKDAEAGHSEGTGFATTNPTSSVLRAAGASWIDCAAGAGVDVRNGSGGSIHRRAISERADQRQPPASPTLFAEAAPKLAERLITLGLDERTRLQHGGCDCRVLPNLAVRCCGSAGTKAVEAIKLSSLL